jgi:hypothetical protein
MEACEIFDFPILSEEQPIFVGKRFIHWSTDLWMLKLSDIRQDCEGYEEARTALTSPPKIDQGALHDVRY